MRKGIIITISIIVILGIGGLFATNYYMGKKITKEIDKNIADIKNAYGIDITYKSESYNIITQKFTINDVQFDFTTEKQTIRIDSIIYNHDLNIHDFKDLEINMQNITVKNDEMKDWPLPPDKEGYYPLGNLSLDMSHDKEKDIFDLKDLRWDLPSLFVLNMYMTIGNISKLKSGDYSNESSIMENFMAITDIDVYSLKLEFENFGIISKDGKGYQADKEKFDSLIKEIRNESANLSADNKNFNLEEDRKKLDTAAKALENFIDNTDKKLTLVAAPAKPVKMFSLFQLLMRPTLIDFMRVLNMSITSS